LDKVSVPSGFKLGSYEILSLLGAGGMGQVYRARDTRLGRVVAIKVLPDDLTKDSDRVERFAREARALASLNHPNIATIHGIEDGDGRSGLVMELVEGETLDDRLARASKDRGMQVGEALAIARQIAEALDAAHEKGIIHRDLKPANVMITTTGTIKVLDFGLAKTLQAPGLTDAANVSQHGDLTEQAGRLLGTAPYMSPEQARGIGVDKRSDIWAFGCVLYEMLAGRRAFDGQTTTDLLAAILQREPDWSALPATTPPAIDRLMRHCLEKEPKRRLRDIGDALPEIDGGRAGPAPPERSSALRVGRWLAGIFAAALLGTALGFVAAGKLRNPTATPFTRVTHLSVVTPPDAPLIPSLQFTAGARGSAVLSPDGSRVVYLAERPGGDAEIFVRQLDEFGVRPIAGTAGAWAPFFSPDGETIAFFAEGKLKRVPVGGGTVSVICDVTDGTAGAGGTWSRNGTIVFAVSTAARQGLFQVPASGGIPEVIAKPGPTEGSYGEPSFVDDGDAVLFVTRFASSPALLVRSLKTGEQRKLVDNVERALYVPTGHLIYTVGSTLMAAPFDRAQLKLAGKAVPVLDNVGAYTLSLSADGTLAYSAPSSTLGNLVWVSRNGAVRPLLDGKFLRPRLSKDGHRLAVETSLGSVEDLALYAFDNQTLSLLNVRGANSPGWSPDGASIIFRREGAIFTMTTDRAGEPRSLISAKDIDGEGTLAPGEWSADGSTYVFVRQRTIGTAADIWGMHTGGEQKFTALVERPRNQWGVKAAPDGNWFSYASDESGQFEIFVQSLAAGGARTQISTGGGWQAVWSPKGDEIFYRSGDRMMAIAISTKPTFSAGPPRELFHGNFASTDIPNYDVTADAQQFVMVQSNDEAEARTIRLIDHWTQELERAVPVRAGGKP
jgi:Tol biopolymer transport system component